MEKMDVRQIISGNIWGKLDWILTQDSLLPPIVHNNIQYLREEQSSMHALLSRLSSVKGPDPAERKWMNEVKDLAYDLEDCIDILLCRLGKPCANYIVARFIHRLGMIRACHVITDEVQRLKTIARDLNEKRWSFSDYDGDDYNGDPFYNGITKRQHLLPSYLSGEENLLVGVKEDQRKLLGWLNDRSATHLRVISLCGMGGTGKTTLASATFENLISSGNFQSWAWVSLSEEFELTELLKDLVRNVTQSEIPSYMNTLLAGQLGSFLSNYLANKRYVVVLDDMWSTDAWTSIKCYLPDSNNGSRIIVTTRSSEVARCAELDFIHELTFLDFEMSMNLFMKIVFDSEKNYPREFEEISRRFVKRCMGLPLGIKAIAYMLARRPLIIGEWLKVEAALSPSFTDSSNLSWILRESIRHLPLELKACALYLSAFPQDCQIKRTRLIRRWIAEGLVREMRGMHVEEVAEMYFVELLQRAIIQTVRSNLSGKVVTCRVHDLILECVVSESSEENFIILPSGHNHEIQHQKIRWLSFHDGTTGRINDGTTLSRVRSLAVIGDVGKLLMLTRMRFLRVLELDGCGDLENHHLEHICKSLMLKYLSIRGTNVSILPREIGKLQFLQTMDIRETMIQKLPLEIFRLPYLLNLLAWRFRCDNESRDEPKKGICLSRNPSILYEISTSTQLKELRVIIDSEEKEIYLSLFAALEKMSKCLRSLLIWDDTNGRALEGIVSLSFTPILLERVILKGYLGRLPDWFLFLYNVTKIILHQSELQINDVNVLEKFPTLLYLRLEMNSYTTEEFRVKGFPNLKQLIISKCPIKTMSFEEGTLPCLETLDLDLDDLELLLGLEHIPRLEKVFLRSSSEASRNVAEATQNVINKHTNNPKLNGVSLGGTN